MAVSLSNITGGAQTGFTSPVINLTADQAPDLNMKQYAATSFGGTVTGALSHTPANPFTLTAYRPKVLRTLSGANPITGVIAPVAANSYGLIVRKGLIPYSGAVARVGIGRVSLDIPAGADTTDPANVRIMISALVGALNQISAGLGDTCVTGIF